MKWNQEPNRSLSLSFPAWARLTIGGLLVASMVYPNMTSAQQQQIFYCVSYYKISPGKERELQNTMTTVDSKVQQERVNKGAISSWYLYEVLSPIGSSAEYDYVMITTSNSFKNTFETLYTFDNAFKKIFARKDAKFFADYNSRLAGTWKLVKQEIYAGLAVADSSLPSGSQLKYIVT